MIEESRLIRTACWAWLFFVGAGIVWLLVYVAIYHTDWFFLICFMAAFPATDHAWGWLSEIHGGGAN